LVCQFTSRVAVLNSGFGSTCIRDTHEFTEDTKVHVLSGGRKNYVEEFVHHLLREWTIEGLSLRTDIDRPETPSMNRRLEVISNGPQNAFLSRGAAFSQSIRNSLTERLSVDIQTTTNRVKQRRRSSDLHKRTARAEKAVDVKGARPRLTRFLLHPALRDAAPTKDSAQHKITAPRGRFESLNHVHCRYRNATHSVTGSRLHTISAHVVVDRLQFRHDASPKSTRTVIASKAAFRQVLVSLRNQAGKEVRLSLSVVRFTVNSEAFARLRR